MEKNVAKVRVTATNNSLAKLEGNHLQPFQIF